MPKLILIKHAPPQVEADVPSHEWKLSAAGREKAAALAARLRSHAPSIIFTSDEPKAVETAEIVAEALGVPHTVAADLHEHDRSNVPHIRSGEFISHVEVFYRKPTERVLGRESAVQALDRFEQAVNDVVAHRANDNVAIVSHGTVIALLAAEHSDHYGFELWRQMGLPSFAVFELPAFKLSELVAKVG